MKTKNTVICDRCWKVSNTPSRYEAFRVDGFESVSSYQNRNKLKDYCSECHYILKDIGRIENNKEYPNLYTR